MTIPRLVVTELEQHLAAFGAGRLVFTSPRRQQIRANNLPRREWATAVQVGQLDPVPTFHDMRHATVSLWIAAGATDLEVAKWAGHRFGQLH